MSTAIVGPSLRTPQASPKSLSDHGSTAIGMTGELAGAVSLGQTFSPLFSAEVRLIRAAACSYRWSVTSRLPCWIDVPVTQ